MTPLDDLDQLERELSSRLTETFDACLGDRRQHDAPGALHTTATAHAGQPPAARRSPRRARVWLGTAAASLLVAIGVVALIDRAGTGPEGEHTGAAVSGASSASDGTGAASPDRSDARAVGDATTPPDVPMYLPSFVPPGYVLDDLSLTVRADGYRSTAEAAAIDTGLQRDWVEARTDRIAAAFPDFELAAPVPPERVSVLGAYVRRDDNSSITATLMIITRPTGTDDPALPDVLDELDPDDAMAFSVNGSPVLLRDTDQGLTASWDTGARRVELQTKGLSSDDVRSLAERIIVADDDTIAVPPDPDWEELPLPAAPPDNPATPSITYRRAGDSDDVIRISRWPNHERQPLELSTFGYVQHGWNVEATTVRGLPAASMSMTDRPGATTYLEWTEGDGHWMITGQLPPAVLVQIADGLEPSSLDAARGRVTDLDRQLMSSPELDRITLDNGLELSVHAIGSAPGAICVHRPAATCIRVYPGGRQDVPTILGGLNVDGEPWILGWIEGQHQPVLVSLDSQRAASSTDDVDGIDGVDDSIVVHTVTGTFIAAPTSNAVVSMHPDSGTIGINVTTVDLLRASAP